MVWRLGVYQWEHVWRDHGAVYTGYMAMGKGKNGVKDIQEGN